MSLRTSLSIFLRRFIRIVFLVIAGHAEILARFGPLVVGDGAEIIAHAPFANHAAGNFGRLHDIVLGAGRHVVDKELFRGSSAHEDDELIEHFFLPIAEAIFLRHKVGGAERKSARDDRHFIDRIAVFDDEAGNRMARFVESGRPFFILIHLEAAPLFAIAHFIARFFHFRRGDGRAAFAAARRAASLRIFSRSAPEAPGVLRAMSLRSTEASILILRA